MTKGISSAVRKGTPHTRTFPEASSGPSATAGAIREGGWPGTAAIAAALGDDLPSGAGAIDPTGPALPPDAAGLVEVVEDDATALAQRLRDAEIESLQTRSLIEVLGGELRRLEAEAHGLEEEIVELEAEMHLCLARGREEAASAAVRSIIPLRRSLAARRGGIDRIEKQHERLVSIAERQSAQFRELLAQGEPALRFGSAPERVS